MLAIALRLLVLVIPLKIKLVGLVVVADTDNPFVVSLLS